MNVPEAMFGVLQVALLAGAAVWAGGREERIPLAVVLGLLAAGRGLIGFFEFIMFVDGACIK